MSSNSFQADAGAAFVRLSKPSAFLNLLAVRTRQEASLVSRLFFVRLQESKRVRPILELLTPVSPEIWNLRTGLSTYHRVKYLPTAFFCSAKKRRTHLGPKAAPGGLGSPEFRVRQVVRTNVGRFQFDDKFDDKAVKLKQEVLKIHIDRF
jgi:hypothetical protein